MPVGIKILSEVVAEFHAQDVGTERNAFVANMVVALGEQFFHRLFALVAPAATRVTSLRRCGAAPDGQFFAQRGINDGGEFAGR